MYHMIGDSLSKSRFRGATLHFPSVSISCEVLQGSHKLLPLRIERSVSGKCRYFLSNVLRIERNVSGKCRHFLSNVVLIWVQHSTFRGQNKDISGVIMVPNKDISSIILMLSDRNFPLLGQYSGHKPLMGCL